MAERSKLREYMRKRHFERTREPPAGIVKASASTRHVFVVQEHHARRRHWDFRLEFEGVLKSWAVTKEPSTLPSLRRLAVETEDHPLDYADFEGDIPKGEYGAGQVKIWDKGTFTQEKPLKQGFESGLVEIVLHGNRLKGRFVLVRTKGEGPRATWLFFKAKPRIAKLRIPSVEKIIGARAPRKKAA